MKILMAHNQYQQRGGEDESTEMEAAMLAANGHEVIRFTENNDRIDGMSRLDVALKTVWNSQSYRLTRELLRAHRPDVMHVQNFFPLLSPAIHHAARAEGVPVVQSLRNYRLLCVNGLFFRDGAPCEDCLRSRLQLPGIKHACYRGSRAGSAAVAAMNATHSALRTWERDVDVFVPLSQFVKDKFVEAGWDARRLTVKPNFVFPDPGEGPGDGGYALFAGRLSEEKGLETLIQAWKQYDPGLPLKVVGDGPLSQLVDAAQRETPSIEWLGRRPLRELYDLMGRATLVVFPSEWYETFGRIAIEAFAKGTPVVISDIGAIAELVEDGVTGYRFVPGDSRALAHAVRRVLDDSAALAQMRRNSRAEYLKKYTADVNVRALEAIYSSAIARRTAA